MTEKGVHIFLLPFIQTCIYTKMTETRVKPTDRECYYITDRIPKLYFDEVIFKTSAESQPVQQEWEEKVEILKENGDE